MSWNKQCSLERIRKAINDLGSVEIVDLVRETDLNSIPLNKAYRVDGAHAYIEIPNTSSLLQSDDREGERCHRRLLRFLHIYQRVTQVVFRETDAIKVDFQNQRLHFVVHKPYNDREKQVAVAVAISVLLRDLIAHANELHEELPDAEVSVGVEAGMSLAVNNGTRGDREPLFLGDPANQAARFLGSKGIYLGTIAREAMGADWATERPRSAPLTVDQEEKCLKRACLGVDLDTLIEAWRRELENTPLAEFKFQRPTPPLSDLDLDALAPSSSRRLEAMAVTADVDGFTRFVSNCLGGGEEAVLVRVLHVIRKELRDVLSDFGGRKVRYIGDCLQGVLAEGTSKTTDLRATVTRAVLCAGAMRDSFGVVLQELPQANPLGLGIGLELGPITLTRLGLKGTRDRCIVGRAVLLSQELQERCKGTETGLGGDALSAASPAIRSLFESAKIQPDITYNKVVFALRSEGEEEQVARVAIPTLGPNVVMPRAYSE